MSNYNQPQSNPSFEARVSERPRIVEQREAELTSGMDNLYFAFGSDIVNAIVSTIPGVSTETTPQTRELATSLPNNVVSLDAYREQKQNQPTSIETDALESGSNPVVQAQSNVDAAFDAFPEPIDYFIGDDDVQAAS